MFPIGLESFSQFFNSETIIVLSVLSVANAILLYFASIKFLLVFQQAGYKNKRYFKWLASPKTPYLSRLMLLCLLGFLFFNVLNTSFQPVIGNETMTSYLGFISYILFVALYIDTEKNVNAKVPLKMTKRLVRLSITFCVLLAFITFGLFVLFSYIAYLINNPTVALLRYSLICAMPILCPYILYVAYLINEPLEAIIRNHYLGIAKQKLDKCDVIKVGITGSYAKTSIKEILRTILSQKYRVLATPQSYNTPLGIALAVTKLDSTYDIFLAEMGAREKGDIKTLTQLVKPSIGVLTGINNQHLESFKTMENLMDTKYELFENMDKDGLAFFTSDSVGGVELAERFEGKKFTAGIDGEDNLVSATNIVVDNKGTTFTLNVKGHKPIKCNTLLLGKHSVSNICLASAIAYKLGLTPSEISQGISRIQSINHRLELVPNNKNIVLIDDSYNSNEDGINAAMEVLDTFKGRKIVLTPGLVELGKLENVLNLEFGKKLANHADIVIIVGKQNAEMLLSGLLEGGMSKENIYFEKTVSRGNDTLNKILMEGDVVLFENDLPDNYN